MILKSQRRVNLCDTIKDSKQISQPLKQLYAGIIYWILKFILQICYVHSTCSGIDPSFPWNVQAISIEIRITRLSLSRITSTRKLNETPPKHRFVVIPPQPKKSIVTKSNIKLMMNGGVVTKTQEDDSGKIESTPKSSTMAISSCITSSSWVNNHDNEIKVLGVCGGIGSGKSTACQLLVSEFHCLHHIDADKVAHLVYEPGSEGIDALIQEFGMGILAYSDDDDENNSNREKRKPKMPYEIHRPSLGNIVFNDPNAMKRLENIVWPRTKQLICEQIDQIKRQYIQQELAMVGTTGDTNDKDSGTTIVKKIPIIIIEAAMLLDANWHHDMLDGVWVVTTTKEVALQRLMEKRQLSYDISLQRYNAQLKRRGSNVDMIQNDLKDNVITAIISNHGTMEELKQQLQQRLTDPNLNWYSR